MAITPETALVAEPERRFRAFALDRAIAWSLFAVSAVAAWWWFFRDDKVWIGIGIIAATVVVVSLVFAVLLGIKGTSPGRSMMGLRVVSADGGAPIGVPRALLRGLIVGAGSLPMFGLGVATLAWTAVEDRSGERRGWHDHVAGSVVLDVRPRPVAEVEADERPRHVVNLTAMKLMPVRQQTAPVVPAPEPAPTPVPTGQPVGQPVGQPIGEPLTPTGFETPEGRRRRIDAPWRPGDSETASQDASEPGRRVRPAETTGPQRPDQSSSAEAPPQSAPPPQRPPGSLQGPGQHSAPQGPSAGPSGPPDQTGPQAGPQQPGLQQASSQPRPQQTGPQQTGPQPGPRQPGPQEPNPRSGPQGPYAPGQVPGHPTGPPPNRQAPPQGGGATGGSTGRHAGAPAQAGPPNSQAPNPQAPNPQAPNQASPGQRGGQPARPPINWRVTFDTGESFVVEGLGIVGRQPSGRPGEPVRHVVPLRSDDMSISKTHAQFHIASDGALVVIDRGSTNGSLLLRKGVSRELTAGRPTTLVDGDRVCFGDRQMMVTRER